MHFLIIRQKRGLNNLELFCKCRRDEVVKQNRPLLDKLNFLLEWIELDGPLAALGKAMLIIEEIIKENVSFFSHGFITYSGKFHLFCARN